MRDRTSASMGLNASNIAVYVELFTYKKYILIFNIRSTDVGVRVHAYLQLSSKSNFFKCILSAQPEKRENTNHTKLINKIIDSTTTFEENINYQYRFTTYIYIYTLLYRCVIVFLNIFNSKSIPT